MTKLIDADFKGGTLTKIGIDGDGRDRKLLVKTEQDVEPLLRQNERMRAEDSVKGSDNQPHFRIVADIPKAIYLSWRNLYGFDIFSPQRSNWGMGMTAEAHKKFLRSLLNATPALKTVDESL